MLHPESLCDLCKENTASAHIARVVFGETVQQHLCEMCAGQQYAAANHSEETEEEPKMASEFSLETDNGFEENESGKDKEVLAEALADSVRCPQCNTTWDRLRENGRAGCTQCYVTFEAQIFEVVTKLQFSPQHVGKTPQGALRRQRRLEDLRIKQVHRLEMLQRRLEEAVSAENYEEAAALRDKLIEIEATLVSPES